MTRLLLMLAIILALTIPLAPAFPSALPTLPAALQEPEPLLPGVPCTLTAVSGVRASWPGFSGKTNALSGSPGYSARKNLGLPANGIWDWKSQSVTFYSLEDGAFESPRIPAGTYSLVCDASKYGMEPMEPRTFTVGPGQPGPNWALPFVRRPGSGVIKSGDAVVFGDEPVGIPEPLKLINGVYAQQCIGVVEGAALRARVDGQAPTRTAGDAALIQPGRSVILDSVLAIARFLGISATEGKPSWVKFTCRTVPAPTRQWTPLSRPGIRAAE